MGLHGAGALAQGFSLHSVNYKPFRHYPKDLSVQSRFIMGQSIRMTGDTNQRGLWLECIMYAHRKAALGKGYK